MKWMCFLHQDVSPAKGGKMNTKQNAWNSQSLIWWIIIIGVACLVYATGIAHESLWFDEAFSYKVASHSPREILGLMTADNHPPLYYFLLSAVMSIFGNSVWALRLLSVLGAIGLVGLGAGPVRRIFGNRTALVYAGVVLFTPVVLIYAHEARMYSLATFCVTASALYGYLAVKYNHRGDWFVFGLASLAAAYFHYYGLMAAFFMHLLIFLWLLFKKREYLRSYLVTGAAVTVGYLPWLVFFYRQVTMVNKGFWIGAVTWQGILNAMVQPFAYKDSPTPSEPAMTGVLVFSAILIVVGLVLAKLKAGDEWMFGLFALVVLLCSFNSPILISLVSSPIFYARYIVVLDGLFLLLLSLGISLLPGKWLLQVAALGLFAFANIPTLRNVYVENFNPPMDRAAEYLQKEIRPGDPIVTSELLSMGPAVYYLPQAVHYNTKSIAGDLVEQQLKIPFSPELYRDQDVDKLLSTHPSFWYVTCSNGLAQSIGAVLKGEAGWEASGEPITFSGPYSQASITVTKYVYTGVVAAPAFGKLNLHITGLRPPGNLLIALFNDEAAYPTQPSSVAYIGFSDTEMTYTFDGLSFGDYVIYVFHDENNNKTPDRDSATGLFSEGYGWANMDKVDLRYVESVREGTNFDNIKYAFDEDGKTVEIKIYYAPFPWQNQ
jgi:uncharacterized protein (DUF2141 family)